MANNLTVQVIADLTLTNIIPYIVEKLILKVNREKTVVTNSPVLTRSVTNGCLQQAKYIFFTD